jgi:RNA polymerase sigma-70 factor (ECF subfamily)
MSVEVAALKLGDTNCFRKVYAEHHAKLYQYIYNRTHSVFLAQEVVQVAFVRLWENRNVLSDELNIDIQLFRMAKTILIDELRKETVKQKYIDWLNQNTDHSYRDDVVADRDDLRHVLDAMEKLPAMRKTVFKLSRIQGLSYKEIAAMFSISPKTVENHISKAIKQLRNAIVLLLSLFLFI